MKVEGPKSTSSVQSSRKTQKSSGASGAFASELDKVTGPDETPEAGAVEQVSAVAGVDGILAAQSVGSGGASTYEERQRRAKRGVEILDHLEDIRRGLLTGAIPKDKLADLARIVREKRDRGADPVISRMLDEIELRAEVELAKLSRRLA